MSILCTAASEDAANFLETMKKHSAAVLHMPLERYQYSEGAETAAVIEKLDDFETILHGSSRNARFFIEWMKKHSLKDRVKEKIHFTIDPRAAGLLEEQAIPAIMPEGNKAVDLLELMLRLRRIGKSLYPTGAGKTDEIPGLLQELDMEVREMELFTREGPSREQLDNYRTQLNRRDPDVVIFHSRRSVTRTITAFSDLQLEEKKIISADSAVSKKLEEHNVTPDFEAKGTWHSIQKIIEQTL